MCYLQTDYMTNQKRRPCVYGAMLFLPMLTRNNRKAFKHGIDEGEAR
jgi:hypothetical protein